MEPISLQTATRDSSLGTATINTLIALYRFHEGSRAPETWTSLPTFIPAATTLVASDASPPDGELGEFMQQLTSGAQATAISNSHDSIVAGPLSEASNGEFTDVGVWLGRGHYPKGHEKAVLASLGLLEEWMQCSGARITTREFVMPTKCVAGFSTAYQNLKDAHCFCISSGGVRTACFLVGERDHRWCGLASIAITSD